jgi:hypothetical protein
MLDKPLTITAIQMADRTNPPAPHLVVMAAPAPLAAVPVAEELEV